MMKQSNTRCGVPTNCRPRPRLGGGGVRGYLNVAPHYHSHWQRSACSVLLKYVEKKMQNVDERECIAGTEEKARKQLRKPKSL